jgi:hypothetical protein
VVAELRERLHQKVNKQHKSLICREFDLKKLNDAEVMEQC